MTITPSIIAYTASMALAALIGFGGTAHAQAPAAEDFTDLGADTFVQNCLRCHGGILTGNDLMNTSLSSVENLTETVHRMEQFTAPLSEEQTSALVELLKDKEVQFRVEEAQLNQMESAPAITNAGFSGETAADPAATLFIKSCASCHTIGPGTTSGGNLTLTISQPEAVVKANVTRMQVRTGPMTTDQIDQLTALLKDKNRNTRLASMGYKPPATPTPAPTPIPTSTPTEASTGTKAMHMRPDSDEQVSERRHRIPMDILGITIGMAAVVGVAGFFLVRGDKNS